MRPLQELLDANPLPDVANGGKDDKGSLLVIGGPPHCPGAVVLATMAALRIGAGRVRGAVDPSAAPGIAVANPELAVYSWNQKASPPPEIIRALTHANAVVIGPGHTALDDVVVRSTAERTRGVVVLDAGALGAADAVARTRRLVVTPNPSEAAKLLGLDDEPSARAAGAEADLAQALAARLGAPVAVRGATTVLADGHECWLLDDMPPGLGTPGSGDVFAGILGGLLAGGLERLPALAWAVRLHAEAGWRLSRTTPVGYLARELLDELPHVRAASSA